MARINADAYDLSMKIRRRIFGVLAALLLSCGAFLSLRAQGMPASALAGQVTSVEEGPMEGVLVSAKKIGASVTVTVVTDQRGRYHFPASRLEPGTYALRIRAVGYDLASSASAEVPAQGTAKADMQLRKTQDLAAQLTNAEWIDSLPGSPEQKGGLLSCVGCHTVERILRSKYDADRILDTMKRMSGYAQMSTPVRPQRRLADRDRELIGEDRARVQRAQAEWIATVNLSTASTWKYPLKTRARPTAAATKVIITEYDLPRMGIQPHDVIVGPDHLIWFSSFGEMNIGSLDPATGKVTEYPIPEQKKGWPNGVLGLHPDPDGNLWAGMMYQAGVAKLDRKTGKVQVFNVPANMNAANTQTNMAAPQRSNIDGKVWTQNNGFAGVHRIDVASGAWETFEPFKGLPGTHNIYDVIPDSHNNAYFTDLLTSTIGRIDAKSGQVTLYETPTQESGPRRGMMDGQDRLWFGEYRGNRIGMFDTKTTAFKEWEPPTPWSAPYDVAVDKNGNAWTGSMTSDRIARLNPRTGRIVEYLLPRTTNIRRVFVDDSTTPVSFWVGSNHGASIIKLEALD
jgi:virginiamycin B lyase